MCNPRRPLQIDYLNKRLQEEFYHKVVANKITHDTVVVKSIHIQIIGQYYGSAVFSCRLCFLRAFPFISFLSISGLLERTF